MSAHAVVFTAPHRIELREVALAPLSDGDVLVDVEWTAISTGTERLLWSGQMPPFPGLGYPLVPGYESVGRVVEAGSTSAFEVGERVFVPGASCFPEVRSLFGGAASRLSVPGSRVVRVGGVEQESVLFALAATAQHALNGGDGRPAELIVGHGVLGRLLARLAVARGGTPVVWEKNPARATGAEGYQVIDPADDTRRDYRSIYDVSGEAALVEDLIGRLSRGGELVLAGFYSEPISFQFPIAFMREIRLRVAAEWRPEDLAEVQALVSSGRLPLHGLLSHTSSYEQVADAYQTAFTNPDCLKMLIDWRSCS